jgi:hypothetical protein
LPWVKQGPEEGPDVKTAAPIRLFPDAPAIEQAYELARVAHAAYLDDPVDHAGLRSAFETILTFRSTRVFGLVAADRENVVLAFRGTHEDREWIEALAYGQTHLGSGRAHKGCVRLVESVWTQLLAALYDSAADTRRFWITGHSIGGTLALVAAARLEHEGFDLFNVTTFGAPAVLDKTAAEAFRCCVYRVVNNEDVVAELPWPTLLDTYAHAGERILLTASGRIAAAHHSRELARRVDRANTIGEGTFAAGPLHDHAIEAYIEKLRRRIE